MKKAVFQPGFSGIRRHGIRQNQHNPFGVQVIRPFHESTDCLKCQTVTVISCCEVVKDAICRRIFIGFQRLKYGVTADAAKTGYLHRNLQRKKACSNQISLSGNSFLLITARTGCVQNQIHGKIGNRPDDFPVKNRQVIHGGNPVYLSGIQTSTLHAYQIRFLLFFQYLFQMFGNLVNTAVIIAFIFLVVSQIFFMLCFLFFTEYQVRGSGTGIPETAFCVIPGAEACLYLLHLFRRKQAGTESVKYKIPVFFGSSLAEQVFAGYIETGRKRLFPFSIGIGYPDMKVTGEDLAKNNEKKTCTHEFCSFRLAGCHRLIIKIFSENGFHFFYQFFIGKYSCLFHGISQIQFSFGETGQIHMQHTLPVNQSLAFPSQFLIAGSWEKFSQMHPGIIFPQRNKRRALVEVSVKNCLFQYKLGQGAELFRFASKVQPFEKRHQNIL